MKAAPFRVPPFARRIRMKAVRGIGSSVMTRPMRTRSRITRDSRAGCDLTEFVGAYSGP